MTGPDLDRRPIASRDLAVFRALAARLAAAGISPNAISAAGMVAGIAAGVAFVASGGHSDGSAAPRAWLVVAAALVQLRLLCNLLDGMVAVSRGVASRVGELWNEIPDRVSDAAVLVGAGWAIGGDERLGWLAALMALFVAYVRAEGKAAGAKNEFCGPMAKSHRMATLTVAALLAASAPAWRIDVLGPIYPSQPIGVVGLALLVIVVLGLVTAARRVARIASQLGRIA